MAKTLKETIRRWPSPEAKSWLEKFVSSACTDSHVLAVVVFGFIAIVFSPSNDPTHALITSLGFSPSAAPSFTGPTSMTTLLNFAGEFVVSLFVVTRHRGFAIKADVRAFIRREEILLRLVNPSFGDLLAVDSCERSASGNKGDILNPVRHGNCALIISKIPRIFVRIGLAPSRASAHT